MAICPVTNRILNVICNFDVLSRRHMIHLLLLNEELGVLQRLVEIIVVGTRIKLIFFNRYFTGVVNVLVAAHRREVHGLRRQSSCGGRYLNNVQLVPVSMLLSYPSFV